MALSAVLRNGTFSTRKIAVVITIAVVAAVLGLWTRNGLLVAGFVLVASGIAVLGMIAARARRRSRMQTRKDESRTHQEYLDNIATHLDLDRVLIGQLSLPHGDTARPSIVRKSMQPGKTSRFLNRVDVVRPAEPTLVLVEKGVDTDSNECGFWRDERRPQLTLHTDRYSSLEPIAMTDGDPLSVMYFRYIPWLDRERSARRQAFRRDMKAIVTTIADFNGRNLFPAADLGGRPGSPFPPTRADLDDLERRLSVPRHTAKAILGAWDHVHEGWNVVQASYERLPLCLCHNDVSPGNAVHIDGTTMLADFGLAGVGPVGSDLHTIIRWSGKAMDDDDHVEGLLTTYLDGLRPHEDSVTLDDIRLSAWTTFFLRYTNLKFSSARYVSVFNLAVRKMSQVIRDTAASR